VFSRKVVVFGAPLDLLRVIVYDRYDGGACLASRVAVTIIFHNTLNMSQGRHIRRTTQTTSKWLHWRLRRRRNFSQLFVLDSGKTQRHPVRLARPARPTSLRQIVEARWHLARPERPAGKNLGILLRTTIAVRCVFVLCNGRDILQGSY
jgi:hypothetical protein